MTRLAALLLILLMPAVAGAQVLLAVRGWPADPDLPRSVPSGGLPANYNATADYAPVDNAALQELLDGDTTGDATNGTATLDATRCLFETFGYDVTGPTGLPVAISGRLANSSSPGSNVCSNGTGTDLVMLAAGTIIPSFALATAAAAVVERGSYFTCRRIGSHTVTNVGAWD